MARTRRITATGRAAVLAAGLLTIAACGGPSDVVEMDLPDLDAVSIGPACDAALDAARATMAANDGGTLDANLRSQLLADLEAPYDVCNQEEYTKFTVTELEPWSERLGRTTR